MHTNDDLRFNFLCALFDCVVDFFPPLKYAYFVSVFITLPFLHNNTYIEILLCIRSMSSVVFLKGHTYQNEYSEHQQKPKQKTQKNNDYKSSSVRLLKSEDIAPRNHA